MEPFWRWDHARYIPVHILVQKLGKYRASSLLAAHILSGCDVDTKDSKVDTKAAAIKEMDSTLPLFGQSQQAEADILQGSEQYLVKLLGSAGECNTFDDLRYHLYMNKRKTISGLPPTSASMMGHMLRSHFVYIHRR